MMFNLFKKKKRTAYKLEIPESFQKHMADQQAEPREKTLEEIQAELDANMAALKAKHERNAREAKLLLERADRAVAYAYRNAHRNEKKAPQRGTPQKSYKQIKKENKQRQREKEEADYQRSVEGSWVRHNVFGDKYNY